MTAAAMSTGGQGVGQHQREEDEDVLGPLVDADGFGPGFEGGDLFGEGADGGDLGSAEGGAERGGGVGYHGSGRLLEQGQVGQGVADVGEVVAEAAGGMRLTCSFRRG